MAQHTKRKRTEERNLVMRESLSGKFTKKDDRQQYTTISPQINSGMTFFKKKARFRLFLQSAERRLPGFPDGPSAGSGLPAASSPVVVSPVGG